MHPLAIGIRNRFAASVLIVASAFSASAVTYSTWKGASGGYFADLANWSGVVPSSQSTGMYFSSASVGSGPYVISITNDTQFYAIGYSGSDNLNLKPTFDLGGHTLTLSTWAFALSFNTQVYPSYLGDISYTKGLCFRNGELIMGGMRVGDVYSKSWGVCMCDFSNVALTTKVAHWGASSRVVIRDGSVWTLTGDTTMETGYKNGQYGSLVVTGATSRVDSGSYNLTIGCQKYGLLVLDGATATFNDIRVGDTGDANNGVCRVDNSTLTANGALSLGTALTNANGVAVGKGNSLEIKGVNAAVTAGMLRIYEGTKSTVEITVPAAGFANVPLTCGAFDFVAREAGQEDLGATRVLLHTFDWAHGRDRESFTLVKLDVADAEGLAAFAAKIELPDYPENAAAEDLPVIVVSQDGTELVVTSPEVKLAPTFFVTTTKGAAVGQKKINIEVADYGFECATVTGATLRYADNPDFTGATETELLQGATISGAVPQVRVFDVNGAFAEWRRYYARLTLVNEGSKSHTVDFEFYGDGVAQTLYWQQGQSTYDGTWQDATKWYIDSVCANQYPHAEDIVRLPNPDSEFTIAFTEDADFLRFHNESSKYPAITYGTKILDLNGHTLTGHSTYSQHQQCLQIGGYGAKPTTWSLNVYRPAVIIRNGTLQFPNAGQSKILVGAVNADSSGSLVLDQAATLRCDVAYLQDSSRFLITEGSYFEPVSIGLNINGHTGRSPYCTFCVKDANSRANLKTFDLRVNGDRAAAFILDGGRLDCGNLHLGGAVLNDSSSSPASVKTFLMVSNGTVNVTGNLKYDYTRNACVNPAVPFDVAQNPQFIVGGTNTAVTIGGAIDMLEEFDSVIEFQLEPESFNATPVTANSLVITPRPTEDLKVARGLAKLVLTGTKAWVRANHGRSMTLLKLNTDCTAALTTLKNRLVSDSPRITAADLSVSQDGTELLLAAPLSVGTMLLIR